MIKYTNIQIDLDLLTNDKIIDNIHMYYKGCIYKMYCFNKIVECFKEFNIDPNSIFANKFNLLLINLEDTASILYYRSFENRLLLRKILLFFDSKNNKNIKKAFIENHNNNINTLLFFKIACCEIYIPIFLKKYMRK